MKKTIKKSELLQQIRKDFECWQNECSDLDPDYFDESDTESYYNFLCSQHKEDWNVIDDMKGGTDNGRIL